MWFVIGGAMAYAVWLVALWQWTYRRRLPFREGMWGELDKNLALIDANLSIATSNIVLACICVAATVVVRVMK